jgi:hypothetical protein
MVGVMDYSKNKVVEIKKKYNWEFWPGKFDWYNLFYSIV